MSPEQFLSVVRRQQAGLLLDTNVLLLYLMVLVDPSAVRAWKRTMQFTPAHVDLLCAAVTVCTRLITTPHILTEVTDMTGGIPAPLRDRYWDVLSEFARQTRERWRPSRHVADDREFRTFGLADTALALLGRWRRPVVLTVDAALYELLSRRRLPVLNLHHYAFPIP